MPNDLLRDLLIVNRRIFDEAVASLKEQTNRDIDRTLREASLWAYEEANRRPKGELQQVNQQAQQQAEKRIAEIQSAAASRIDELKTKHHEREQRLRAFCEQRDGSSHDSRSPVTSRDQRLAPRDGA
jgi:septin family protein